MSAFPATLNTSYPPLFVNSLLNKEEKDSIELYDRKFRIQCFWNYQRLKVRIIQPLLFDFNRYFPLTLWRVRVRVCAILNPYRVPVITYLHTNSSKTPRIIRGIKMTLYWEAFCFHFCLVFVPRVRKMKRMRAEDKEQTGDSEVWSVCEPGNTSLNRRWALSQPFSQTKHTAPNKDNTVP